jgi:hypothetical protein
LVPDYLRPFGFFTTSLRLTPANRFHPPTVVPVVFGISTLAFVTGTGAAVAAAAAFASGILASGAGTDAGTGVSVPGTGAPAPRPPACGELVESVEGLALGVPVPEAELARPKFGTGAVSAGLLFKISIVISFWPRGALMLQNGLYIRR